MTTPTPLPPPEDMVPLRPQDPKNEEKKTFKIDLAVWWGRARGKASQVFNKLPSGIRKALSFIWSWAWVGFFVFSLFPGAVLFRLIVLFLAVRLTWKFLGAIKQVEERRSWLKFLIKMITVILVIVAIVFAFGLVDQAWNFVLEANYDNQASEAAGDVLKDWIETDLIFSPTETPVPTSP